MLIDFIAAMPDRIITGLSWWVHHPAASLCLAMTAFTAQSFLCLSYLGWRRRQCSTVGIRGCRPPD